MPKLVVDRFRPVERRVGQGMALLGSILGGATVVFAIRTIQPFWVMFALMFGSLVVGAFIALAVNLSYRIFFPDGIPKDPASDYISPGWYGEVIWRHYSSFTRRLSLCVAPCAGWLIISEVLSLWR